MIRTEIIEINGKTFKRTYSDENKYIRKDMTDEIYSEAVDVIGSMNSYSETDDVIKDDIFKLQ